MPDDDRAGRQVVGRVEPPRQALRQDQQRRAGDAAEKVRRLDHAERQDAIEQSQPARGRRRGAREEQHQPGEKREDRQHAWRQLLGQSAERRAHARHACAALPHLVGDSPIERDRSAEAGSTRRDTRRAPAAAAADGRYGLRSSTISPSNTPTPPGTWLAMPSRIATRKTPRNGRNDSALGGQQHVQHRAGQRPVDAPTAAAAPAAIAATAAAARSVRSRSGRRRSDGRQQSRPAAAASAASRRRAATGRARAIRAPPAAG